ncbi:MAG: hypothetical protein WKF96_21155 [Solirubrobacteraceae bacterium]
MLPTIPARFFMFQYVVWRNAWRAPDHSRENPESPAAAAPPGSPPDRGPPPRRTPRWRAPEHDRLAAVVLGVGHVGAGRQDAQEILEALQLGLFGGLALEQLLDLVQGRLRTRVRVDVPERRDDRGVIGGGRHRAVVEPCRTTEARTRELLVGPLHRRPRDAGHADGVPRAAQDLGDLFEEPVVQ